MKEIVNIPDKVWNVVEVVVVVVVVSMLFGLMPGSARRSGSFVGRIPRHIFCAGGGRR